MPGIDETADIPEGSHVDGFLRRIEYVNRRARRQGMGLSLDVTEVGRGPAPVRVTRTAYREGAMQTWTETASRPCVRFRIRCPEPVIALEGWTCEGYVAAKNARRDTATGTVRAHGYTAFEPGGAVPQEFLDGAFSAKGTMRCDHCGTFRNRRVGIIVRNADGARRIVGSTCVRDHLGHDPKALVAYYGHIRTLVREVERERSVGWYALHEYDFAAARAAEEAERAAADARTHSVRSIVSAILAAMTAQGFFALRDGQGKTATATAALAILAGPAGDRSADDARVSEILAWMRRTHPFSEVIPEGVDTLALGAYRAVDPDFRAVQAYREAGHPPVGRFFDGGETVELRLVTSRTLDDDADDRWAAPRTEYVFEDAQGSRILWTTGSSPDREMVSGRPFRAAFATKRAWIDGVRATSAVSRLRRARDARGPAGKDRA